MKIQVDNITFNLLLNKADLDSSKIPVVFLHGFTGSAGEWSFIFSHLNNSFFPIAIDLIGHGQTDTPNNSNLYTAEKQADQLKAIFEQLKIHSPVIIGYSMGGRLALNFSIQHPKIPRALILESFTPGISSEDERIARVMQDKELAKRIMDEGIDNFIEYWLNIPLFDTQKNLPEKIQNQIKEFKAYNDPIGLANSLIGFSTGFMSNCWPKLKNINTKTLLITGEFDTKFTDINDKATLKLPNAEHKIIPFCGHNTHLEKPEEFTILVNEFLEKL